MPGLTAADLIFSEQANHNFSRTLADLKRSTLSIHNRLASILADAAFAKNVAKAYGRPLIANERCGSWYIDPAIKGGSAYFKSTDGHTGVWKFSSRRLNLHLLEPIGKNDGCIIIDSTRRGKRMPDALSKTIPVWCAVMNRYLFPDIESSHKLFTPPQVVSSSEAAQMSALLPSFLEAFQSLNIDAKPLRKHIKNPLRPFWVTPENDLLDTTTIYTDFHPVICCTVSRRVAGTEVSESGYIQGAGDDTENWAHGLTPRIFWQHQEVLLATSESELPLMINSLLAGDDQKFAVEENLKLVTPTSNLFIGKVALLPKKPKRDTITIILRSEVTVENVSHSQGRFEVGLGTGKVAARKLRWLLPRVVDFIRGKLLQEDAEGATTPEVNRNISECTEGTEYNNVNEASTKGTTLLSCGTTKRSCAQIVIACETGSQTSIGVGLAIVCTFYNDEGVLLPPSGKQKPITKEFIRRRLAWFSTSLPDANPSRDVLQSVNGFLMDYRPGQ